MNCVICKHQVLTEGHTSLTLERGGVVLVFNNVPAQVCDTCGEAYMDEAVSRNLLTAGEKAAAAGVDADVRQYVAA